MLQVERTTRTRAQQSRPCAGAECEQGGAPQERRAEQCGGRLCTALDPSVHSAESLQSFEKRSEFFCHNVFLFKLNLLR